MRPRGFEPPRPIRVTRPSTLRHECAFCPKRPFCSALVHEQRTKWTYLALWMLSKCCHGSSAGGVGASGSFGRLRRQTAKRGAATPVARPARPRPRPGPAAVLSRCVAARRFGLRGGCWLRYSVGAASEAAAFALYAVIKRTIRTVRRRLLSDTRGGGSLADSARPLVLWPFSASARTT